MSTEAERGDSEVSELGWLVLVVAACWLGADGGDWSGSYLLEGLGQGAAKVRIRNLGREETVGGKQTVADGPADVCCAGQSGCSMETAQHRITVHCRHLLAPKMLPQPVESAIGPERSNLAVISSLSG